MSPKVKIAQFISIVSWTRDFHARKAISFLLRIFYIELSNRIFLRTLLFCSFFFFFWFVRVSFYFNSYFVYIIEAFTKLQYMMTDSWYFGRMYRNIPYFNQSNQITRVNICIDLCCVCMIFEHLKYYAV